MISDRTANSLLATLLSIPPIVLVAALVDRMLPPAPQVPAIVAANDRRIDAVQARPKGLHVYDFGSAARPVSSAQYDTSVGR